jgi:hypothetical protein
MVMSSLKTLSLDEKKQALLKISQFVLREPSEHVRESIYKRMMEIGIYLSQKHACTLEDVLDVIERQFFGIKLERSVAEECLGKLKEDGAIRVENGGYILQEDRRTQIESHSKTTLNLVASCEAKFMEQVKRQADESISGEDVQTLINCFYRFVIRLVSRHILNTAKLVVKGAISSISVTVGRNLVNQSTRNVKNKQLRKAARATLIEWMQNPEDDFVEYLFYMRQNFLCIEVLNLDPQCRMVERAELSKKRLFLDTNVLLGRILQTDYHAQTKRLIDNSRKLGCSIYVTKRTLTEFNNLLHKAKALLKEIKATSRQLSTVNNVFIRSYGRTLLSGSASSPGEYIGQFSDMKNFLKRLGIEVFDEENEEIKELSKYSELVEEVKRCFSKHRGRPKTDDVAEHDAFNLLLVKALRESETDTIFGPDDWFLSRDLTLPCCDNFISLNFDFSEPTSAVMVDGVWNEIISPFLIGIVTKKDLIEVLKLFISSEFTPISEYLDAEILAKSEIDWTEYDWLEVEEIREITQQKFVLKYISRRDDVFKTGDREAIENLRSEFNVAFSRLIGQISNRKIEQVKTELRESRRKIEHVKTELKEREGETEDLKRSVKGLEETEDQLRESLTSEQRVALRMRYVSGISGVGSLIIGATLILLMKETASPHMIAAYIAFLIIGVILLLMSIAPKQVSAALGLSQ